MREFKQRRAYDCGVYAVKFFLALHGVDRSASWISSRLKPTPKQGTSHLNIQTFFSTHDYEYEIGVLDDGPCLVNYQWGGDGHYGVCLFANRHYVAIFNPATGKTDTMPYPEFYKRWTSKRYGDHWSLRLK